MNMVYNKATGTVVILDNSTTGMTGHQDHPATGKTLMGETTYIIDIYKMCKAMGIEHVYEIDAFDIDKLEQTLKEEVKREALSVIITKSPCALLKSYVPKGKCKVDPEVCKKCGKCLVPGCPAITKGQDGKAVIDDTMCNGCGLCQSLCPFDAISLEKQ
jgi:indolepyruvate ferredoxin oxidoreductase alpha subunit